MATPTFALGVLLAQDPALSQLRARLFTNSPAAGQGSFALGDLQEPATPGYAASDAADWFGANCDDEDCVVRKSKPIDFRATGASPGTTVKGVFVTIFDGTAEHVLAVQPFPNARAFAAAGDNVVCSVEVVVYNEAGFPAP